MKWDIVRYDDIAALCAATRFERHGVGADPALLEPAGGKFAPAPGSPLVDTSLRLYGINHAHAGPGPGPRVRGAARGRAGAGAWPRNLSK